MAVGLLRIDPDQFYRMSMREYFAALYQKFPPEEKDSHFVTSESYFSDEELEVFNEMLAS